MRGLIRGRSSRVCCSASGSAAKGIPTVVVCPDVQRRTMSQALSTFAQRCSTVEVLRVITLTWRDIRQTCEH
jgi:hypothetical protein